MPTKGRKHKHKHHKQRQHQHIDPNITDNMISDATHVAFAEDALTQQANHAKVSVLAKREAAEEASFWANFRSLTPPSPTSSEDDDAPMQEIKELHHNTRANQKAAAASAQAAQAAQASISASFFKRLMISQTEQNERTTLEQQAKSTLVTKRVIEEVQERFNMNDAEGITRRGINRSEGEEFAQLLAAEKAARESILAKPKPTQSATASKTNKGPRKPKPVRQGLFAEKAAEAKPAQEAAKPSEDNRYWFNPTRMLW